MNYLILALLFSFNASAQVITFNEAMALFDQHADVMKKVEVGQQLLNESYEMHGECVIIEKNIMTIVDLRPEYALVLTEQTMTDKCKGTEVSKKFLSEDRMINLEVLKAELAESLKNWKITRKESLITFETEIGTDKFTMQYELVRSNLFSNWVHYHHSYPGVEDHNIRFALPNRIIPMSEVEGLPLCQRRPLTLEIISCE